MIGREALVKALRKKGVKVVVVDSDGHIGGHAGIMDELSAAEAESVYLCLPDDETQEAIEVMNVEKHQPSYTPRTKPGKGKKSTAQSTKGRPR